VDGQSGAYVWYLLRYRVAEILGRKPTAEDLHELAVSAYPQFSVIIKGDVTLLEGTLRSVFELESAQQKLTGGKLVVLGFAALGALLDDPKTELDRMRPHLADWWRRHSAEFRAGGAVAGAERP